MLLFRYHEVSVMYGPLVLARRILSISVPFSASELGPLLRTVPFR